MPRFFFTVHDDDVTPDDEGVALPDRAAAIAEATRSARGLAAEGARCGCLCLWHRIEVSDEDGMPVATVTFREAVTVRDSPQGSPDGL
jgi:hypothetical protein